jgi:hypothetical protein
MKIIRELFSNRAIRRGGIALGGLLLLAGIAIGYKEYFYFNLLKLRDFQRDTEEAQQIASYLKDTSRGITLALDDMDCWGGKTKGWSTWILASSSLPLVNDRLERILRDESEWPGRRIQAAWILWRRTRKSSYLIDLFKLVKHEGSTSVKRGRQYLASIAQTQAIQEKLQQNENISLSLTVAEFEEYLKKGLIGKQVEK